MHNVEKKIGWDQAIPTYKGPSGIKNVSSAYPPKSGKIYGTTTFWITVNVPKIE